MINRLPSSQILFLLGTAFLPACQACSNAEQTPTADAAAGHSGGSGGMPRTGGSGTSGSAGTSAGSAGSGGSDAGVDTGPQPLWEEVGESVGFSFDRVTNAPELRLFRWAPCKDGSETVNGCESAEFLIHAFHGDKFEVNPATVVHDNGSQVLTGIVFTRNGDHVLVFTDGEGFVQEAFRARRGSEPAPVTHPAIWGSRYALLAFRNSEDIKKDGKHPAVFGSFGSQTHQVVTLDTWTIMPFGKGVVGSPMGESRWLWDWSPQAGFVSFSSHDGSDARVIYRQYEHPEVWNIGLAVSTGTHFLFAEDLVIEDRYESRVSITDGINPPITYLMIEEGADVGTLRFAHSHVGWLQGTGFQDYNKYDHVEIWASPYSPVPSELAPYKVGEDPELPTIFGYVTGAFGKMAYGLMRSGMEHRVWKIWDLEKKTFVEHVLPSDTRAWQVLAMTRDHFWMIGSSIHTGSNGDFLFRLRSTP